MSELETYLQDHLAGSRFALNLLSDLRSQSLAPAAAALAAELQDEIEADREVLERMIANLGSGPHVLKEFSAWLAQKTGRLKFSVGDLFGIFEAVEFLCLGVWGKRALWQVSLSLQQSQSKFPEIDFTELIHLAERQHLALEKLRMELGLQVLR
jgi:hypothetical protein